MASMRSLKDRWRGDGQALARAAVEHLVLGRSVAGLEVDRVDGRVDLRGLWLAGSRGLPGLPSDPLGTVPTATDVEWTDVDLSGSTFPIHVRDAVLTNVRLDGAGWPDWNVESSSLVDCSFVRADLGSVVFDRNPGLQDEPLLTSRSRLHRCDFTRTRLGPYGGFGRADVDDCLFASTRFPSPMWFRGASLRSCRFRGTFRTVCFGWTGPHGETPPHLDVDVAGASFESCETYAHSGPGVRARD